MINTLIGNQHCLINTVIMLEMSGYHASVVMTLCPCGQLFVSFALSQLLTAALHYSMLFKDFEEFFFIPWFNAFVLFIVFIPFYRSFLSFANLSLQLRLKSLWKKNRLSDKIRQIFYGQESLKVWTNTTQVFYTPSQRLYCLGFSFISSRLALFSQSP